MSHMNRSLSTLQNADIIYFSENSYDILRYLGIPFIGIADGEMFLKIESSSFLYETSHAYRQFPFLLEDQRDLK